MPSKLDWIITARDGGNVTRYHTRQLIKPQQNAHHSYNSAIIAESLSNMVPNVDAHKVVMHMLIHDVPEIGIGDMPHYVKKEQPEIRRLLEKAEFAWCNDNMPHHIASNMKKLRFTEEEVFVVNFTDQFEPMLMMRDELALGNRDALGLFEVMYKTCRWILQDKYDFDEEYKRIFASVQFMLDDFYNQTKQEYDYVKIRDYI